MWCFEKVHGVGHVTHQSAGLDERRPKKCPLGSSGRVYENGQNSGCFLCELFRLEMTIFKCLLVRQIKLFEDSAR